MISGYSDLIRQPPGEHNWTYKPKLKNLGLYLNSAKTTVLEGDAVVEQALEIEHSAVDDAMTIIRTLAPSKVL